MDVGLAPVQGDQYPHTLAPSFHGIPSTFVFCGRQSASTGRSGRTSHFSSLLTSSFQTAAPVRGALEVVWELGSIVSDRLIDLRLSETFFGYLL